MKSILNVPAHWPMSWWSAGLTAVRLSCPKCGAFSAMLNRPMDLKPTIRCEGCGLDGLPAFQKEFDRIAPVIEKEPVP